MRLRRMEWVYLEIGWAVGLKYTDGFSRLWPTVLIGVFGTA